MWRWMSPPARQTPPPLNIRSLARQGGAPDQGAEVYTVLGEVILLQDILLPLTKKFRYIEINFNFLAITCKDGKDIIWLTIFIH